MQNQGAEFPTPCRIFTGATRSGVCVFPGAKSEVTLAARSKGSPDRMVTEAGDAPAAHNLRADSGSDHRLFFPNGKIVHKTLQESLGAIEIVPCVIAPQIAGLECQAAVNLQFGSPHLV